MAQLLKTKPGEWFPVLMTLCTWGKLHDLFWHSQYELYLLKIRYTVCYCGIIFLFKSKTLGSFFKDLMKQKIQAEVPHWFRVLHNGWPRVNSFLCSWCSVLLYLNGGGLFEGRSLSIIFRLKCWCWFGNHSKVPAFMHGKSQLIP